MDLAEIAAGPLGGADNWLDAIVRKGSLATAWEFTDPDFRQDLAAAWVSLNLDFLSSRGFLNSPDQDPEDLVDELASLDHQDGLLWSLFDHFEIEELRGLLAVVDIDSWCWATDPRPLGVDLEGAVMIDAGPLDETGQPLEPLTPGVRPALAFVMHYLDGAWLVSALSLPGPETAT